MIECHHSFVDQKKWVGKREVLLTKEDLLTERRMECLRWRLCCVKSYDGLLQGDPSAVPPWVFEFPLGSLSLCQIGTRMVFAESSIVLSHFLVIL